MKWIAHTIDDLPQIAKAFLEVVKGKFIFAFDGEMGAGKTTFIAELIKELGVLEWEGSPTYSIVNEYLGKDEVKIFHFDLFRLKDEMEAYDIGMDEFLEGNYYCFIEWAEKIPNLLPNDVIWVYIRKKEDFREITIAI
jgi:tRNA threonylcarbamoyladenosine biosynthesis protein TsaE